MILASLLTHINTIINIPDYFHRGQLVSILRVLAIVTMCVLSAILFSTRNTDTFPVSAGPLSILPAVCFEARNGTTTLGFGDVDKLLKQQSFISSPKSGFAQYGVLMVLFLMGGIILVLDNMKKMCCAPGPVRRWITCIFRVVQTIGGSLIMSYTVVQYVGLRNAMEVPELYRVELNDSSTMSQILLLVLLVSSAIALANATLGEALCYLWIRTSLDS